MKPDGIYQWGLVVAQEEGLRIGPEIKYHDDLSAKDMV